jgi:UDP-2,3-diacylglucosamine pyrophosphatase LpxH
MKNILALRSSFKIKSNLKSNLNSTFTNVKKPRMFSTQYPNTNNRTLQYVSDIHTDTNGFFPKIKPQSDNLAICGDIGVPTNPICEDFLKYCSDNFKAIFFVPGNHDFDCGPVFNRDKVEKYEDIYKNICQKFKNINYCNKTVINHENVLIAGTTLWSKADLNYLKNDNVFSETQILNTQKTVDEHLKHVAWLENIIKKNNNNNKKIIILSHFVPSYKLIEEKYKKFNTSFYASNLEYLLESENDKTHKTNKTNVHAWLCGHTHSISNTYHNGVYLGVNAYGYKGIDINTEYEPCVITY